MSPINRCRWYIVTDRNNLPWNLLLISVKGVLVYAMEDDANSEGKYISMNNIFSSLHILSWPAILIHRAHLPIPKYRNQFIAHSMYSSLQKTSTIANDEDKALTPFIIRMDCNGMGMRKSLEYKRPHNWKSLWILAVHKAHTVKYLI